jgi:hypothetical protein
MNQEDSFNDNSKWIFSLEKKPEEFVIVDGICRVGQEFDVIECWWSGDNWVVTSVRSRIVSKNVWFWRPRPSIPKEILDKINELI